MSLRLARRLFRSMKRAALGLASALTTLSCSNVTDPPRADVSASAALAQGSVHRLNAAEYNATVADVLGTELEPAAASWREAESLGFDNVAAVLGVDGPLYERYFATAEVLAKEVSLTPLRRAQLVSCDLSQSACVTESIRRAGLRTFRRPLNESELGIYTSVFARGIELGDSPSAAFELVLRALLSSFQFIYRVEIEAAANPEEPYELGAFDLASRLSYFLWSSAPDDELLQAASDGSLLSDETLSVNVERMLRDPRASRLTERFAGQWLGARRVVAHAAAPELYQWTPQVAQAAGNEMLLFFAELLDSERPWNDFVTADVNYVTEPLARYYGIPTPAVELARVEHHEDGRAGFFGLAGFLALSSFDRRTSPSLRGRFIASTLLCDEPPAPPSDVPKLEASAPTDPALSDVRKRLEMHRESPACASCHARFDPYGLALEQYDAVGQFRTAYPDGSLIDASATLPASAAYPNGVTFSGLAGLSELVAADPRFGHCLAEKLLTYALGRRLEGVDAVALTSAVERWRAPSKVTSVRALIRELVLSTPFRTRLPEAQP